MSPGSKEKEIPSCAYKRSKFFTKEKILDMTKKRTKTLALSSKL